MFNGTILGNLSGFLYFTLYIVAGVFISHRIFSRFSSLTRLWLGTVMGTVLLMWLPVLVSFLMGFNILSHTVAAVVLAGLCVCSFVFTRKSWQAPSLKLAKKDVIALSLVGIMTVFYGIVEANHIMAPSETGGMIFGQSTYFDANIHLSFITTPVAQGDMPFCYNILPTMQVSYPFLSDTISSSIYVFGASLRWSYIVPTILGAFNVYLGCFIFFELWLKRYVKALLAWILFVFNGGFGFMYFFDNLRIDSDNFNRIFENLYETPTNLDGNMIRWVNTFCDMMIPQRATLFGWMMLFAVLYLLYRAVFQKETRLFIPAAVLAGLTPLISTHIFLSLGIICAIWMLSRVYVMLELKPIYALVASIILLALGVILFILTAKSTGTSIENVDYDKAGFTVLVACGSVIGLIYASLTLYALVKGFFKEIFFTWGIFLIIVLTLALPQLLLFTFKQSSGSSFLKPHFNWINWRDEYFWFYIKNIGVPALLFIPALFNSSKRNLAIVAPIAVLMLIAETVALTPNTYDNNKIIYPAFVLAIGLVADYMVVIYDKLKGVGGRRIIAAVVLCACVLSGALSMGREYVAGEYEIFPASQVKAAWWMQNNTEGDDVFLCNDRYNNALSGLSGRNLVCGSNSFFSTHGLPGFSELQSDIKKMYSDPEGNLHLYEKYNVDYIVVGSEERNSYSVNEDGIKKIAKLVYDQSNVAIYKMN